MKFFLKHGKIAQTTKKPVSSLFFKLGLVAMATGITLGGLSSCKTTYPSYEEAKKAYSTKFETAKFISRRELNFFETIEIYDLKPIKTSLQKNPQLYFDVLEKIDNLIKGATAVVVKQLPSPGISRITAQEPQLLYEIAKISQIDSSEEKLGFISRDKFEYMLPAFTTNCMAVWLLEDKEMALGQMQKIYASMPFEQAVDFLYALCNEKNACLFMHNASTYISQYAVLSKHLLSWESSDNCLSIFSKPEISELFFLHPVQFYQLLKLIPREKLLHDTIFSMYFQGGKVYEIFKKDPEQVIEMLERFPFNPQNALKHLESQP